MAAVGVRVFRSHILFRAQLGSWLSLAGVRVCAACGRGNPPDAGFCNGCGAALAAPAQHEKRKTVTVLFCDVTGSTALGERLDPESFRQVMRRYFDAARRVIEHHGGTVEKFIGDAVMAGGCPELSGLRII